MARSTTRDMLAGFALAIAVAAPAAAQVPSPGWAAPAQPALPGWQFSVTPYFWLPTISADGSMKLPGGSTRSLDFDISEAPSDYLKSLNFAAALALEARKDRFFVGTDVYYADLRPDRSRIRSADIAGTGRVPVADTGTSAKLRTTIWTVVGGYGVLRNESVQLDAFAGVRTVFMVTDIGWRITGAARGLSLVGDVSDSSDVVDGIAGIKGRIRIGQTAFSVPFYADIGAGGSNLTWQLAGGLAYELGWGDVSLTYRYLQYRPNSGSVNSMSLGGPQLTATFRF